MKIHTLETRSYFLPDVVKEYLNLSFEEMGKEIKSQYNIMIEELELKGIKYSDLKNTLTPQKDKKDICLVFDTTFIKESWYGYEIFKKYFPLLADSSGHCVFEGDLVGSNDIQKRLYNEMAKEIKIANPYTFKNSCQYALVYINNLTDAKINKIINGLKPYQEFTGYFDFTYSSLIKDHISNTIGQRYFIYKKNIVMASGEDEYNKENINIVSYDFEKYGFQIKSISNMNYSMFLTYKIERKYYDTDISDQLFSLSVISDKVEPLRYFKVTIEEEKLEYLLAKKSGSMKAGKLWDLEKTEIEELIKNKIENDYIYNLEIIEEHNTIKFNIIIEIESDKNKFKYLVSLEYLPEIMELRLITMY